MITVLFFAGLREQLDTERLERELPEGVSTVAGLADHLAAEGGEAWQTLLDDQQVLVAVDQTIVDRQQVLRGNEEVAFFPPVTGG